MDVSTGTEEMPAVGTLSDWQVDLSCPVCLQHYNRSKRVPRRLHCSHTLCTPCMARLALRLHGGMLAVCCPLCRWHSCSASWKDMMVVDGAKWDCLANVEDEESDTESISATQEPRSSHLLHPLIQLKRGMREAWIRLRHGLLHRITRKCPVKKQQEGQEGQPR